MKKTNSYIIDVGSWSDVVLTREHRAITLLHAAQLHHSVLHVHH